MFRPKLFTLIKNRPEEFTPRRVLKDIGAGAVVAFIAMPLSIALAIASGVTPEIGLATAVIAGFLISFFGGSRVQIGGPTAAFVIIILGITAEYGHDGLIAATAMAGIILIIMGFLKLGSVIQYIPYPVTTGFTSGIAVVLFSTQVNDFLGLNLTNMPSEFFDKWLVYFQNLNHIDLPTVFIGMLALAIIMFWPKKLKAIPGTLAAIIITTLVVKFFHLDIETIYSRFGEIGHSFPKPHLPNLTWDMIQKLLRPAFVIAVLAGIESLLSAVVADGMIGKRHRSNTELIAQGIANTVSAAFGGLPATGAIARTTANIENGGRTPIAGIMHAVCILIMMLLFMPYISLVPMATLAAILFTVAYRMSEWRSFVFLFKAPLSDILVLLTTFLLTVMKDLVIAIEVGMILAAILFIKRMVNVYNIARLTDDDLVNEFEEDDDLDKKTIAQHVRVYEINGPFFFGAANMFLETLENIADCKVLILRMRSVPAMDATAFHALNKIYLRCKKDNITLILSEVPNQPYKTLRKYNFVFEIGKENVLRSFNAALKKAAKTAKEKQASEETK
ncbi:Sulfate permease [Elusimicrobium minutum Pei191]|uniref:Sulfate permease n=1 Tax=Elusimicrobium minutum (strain Pei191) TaxID=445932 RepID=B2KBE0_ELUMP|nr:SulP family inorganic anion transporter [Elusimicrobium minutum]ACC97962.1 Sulfate permease [Elusimicrobium minutum Pei191]